MKSLSLTRPLVIMMIGGPGAGKSFFARQFSETFSAPLVSHDTIRTLLFTEPSYQRDEDELVTAVADNQIDELFKTHKTFIIDGGMNVRTERLGIEKMAKVADYGTLVIWVQTDDPTSRYRAMKRSERRAGDTWNRSLTAEQFDSIAKRLTPPSPSETYAVISGKHTYATQAKVILKKLVSPREEGVRTPVTPTRQAGDNDQPAPRSRSITIN